MMTWETSPNLSGWVYLKNQGTYLKILSGNISFAIHQFLVGAQLLIIAFVADQEAEYTVV